MPLENTDRPSTSPTAMTTSTKPLLKKPWTWLTVVAILVLGLHQTVVYAVSRMVNVSIEFGSELDEQLSQRAIRQRLDQQSIDHGDLTARPQVEPFREVDLFDDDAKDWSNLFDGYFAAGALVFDANGDDRLDVYLTHNNATWTRPTDEDGVLLREPRIRGNGLYLNQGSDPEGQPIFTRIDKIATGNDTYAAEELVVENYLFPRQSRQDSQARVGRATACAIAADLNNDGRLDLLTGNILPGMIWSHPKTQRVLGQFVRPVGRQAVNTKTPLAAQGLYFLKDYLPSDQIDDLRQSARGAEPEPIGANSVFLNLGDRDQDGLPEWRDASRELGLEGKRTTAALLAADFDLDGDLDIFEANVMDLDFWPGGATAHAGAANQLYINQLAETGTLTFVERSAEMNVDGLYDEHNPMPDYYRLYKWPLLPEVYSVALLNFVEYRPEFLEINNETSEPGQISWAAVTQDVNDDGYPDIWVANDLGFLRLYVNQEGKRFVASTDHARGQQTGLWMSLSPGDWNGDLAEDLFAGNMGGATMSLTMPIPDPFSLFDPVLTSTTLARQFIGQTHNSMHALLDGASSFRNAMPNTVRHSSVLPPDASLANNIRNFVLVDGADRPFDQNSIDPYEFTWGSTTLDVQNDGRPDLYWVGCLYGRGGGIFPIMGTGPGRLLVNTTEHTDDLRLIDLTAEHHLFNIQELEYDKLESEGILYRKSPLQNWGKRSMVTSYDVSVWGFQGPGVVERITNHDLIQTAENGRAAVAADLNGDGFSDILIRNIGGYDSRASSSQNLKARIGGKARVIPAHDANFPTPTQYEPGSTRVFLNTYSDNHWIKIRLIDDAPDSFNRHGVGAKVIVNQRNLQVLRSGSGGFISNAFGPLLFGLGEDSVNTVEIQWPDAQRTVTELALPGCHNGLLTLSKREGLVGWTPHGNSESC